jgi:YidC/Oxa1 family membrane protein insertase
MDRNQVIGFSLLALLLIGYITYNQHEQKQYQEKKKADSIAYAKSHPHPVIDSSKTIAATMPVADSAAEAQRRLMPPAFNGVSANSDAGKQKAEARLHQQGCIPGSSAHQRL